MKTRKNKLVLALTISLIMMSIIIPFAVFAEDSDTSSGPSIQIGTPIKPPPPVTSAPLPPPVVPQTPAPPPVVTSAPISIPKKDLPPPPSANDNSEWSYSNGDNRDTTSSPALPPMSATIKQRSGFTKFFSENWWWIVGISILIIGGAIIIISRKNQD